ncbi:MAG: hypothetical protein CSYNP_03999 [Syntrophus sp. SKADARSKE-3]|nr:hypothetical protein [Syntrophus sp. SKADARSKE-3]
MRMNIKPLLHQLIVCLLLATCTSAHAESHQVYILAPSVCCVLEKVDGNKVYLGEDEKECLPGIVRMPVTLEATYAKVEIYYKGTLWKTETPSTFGMDTAAELKSRAEKMESMDIKGNIHAKKGQELAEDMQRYFQSKEFQDKVESETERIKKQLFPETVQTERYYSDAKTSGNQRNRILEGNEKIYIFISSSMPLQTLKMYAAALDRVRDPNIMIVMRGRIEGKGRFKETIKFVRKIIQKDSSCDFKTGKCEVYVAGVNIDPVPFAVYNVSVVPAIVYATGLEVRDPDACPGKRDNVKYKDYHSVYGDVSLEYALELIRRETKSKSIEYLQTALRAGIYK